MLYCQRCEIEKFRKWQWQLLLLLHSCLIVLCWLSFQLSEIWWILDHKVDYITHAKVLIFSVWKCASGHFHTLNVYSLDLQGTWSLSNRLWILPHSFVGKTRVKTLYLACAKYLPLAAAKCAGVAPSLSLSIGDASPCSIYTEENKRKWGKNTKRWWKMMKGMAHTAI